MSLRHIVDALGGDLYDGGRRASVPGPNHSAGDRSVSLLLQGGRVVVNTFGRTVWTEVLDDLRERGLIDRDNAPIDGPGVRVVGRPSAPAPSDRKRLPGQRRAVGPGAGVRDDASQLPERSAQRGPSALRSGAELGSEGFREGHPSRRGQAQDLIHRLRRPQGRQISLKPRSLAGTTLEQKPTD
jgi:hypothetical protein